MEREIQTNGTEGLNTAISYVALLAQRLACIQQIWMLKSVKIRKVF